MAAREDLRKKLALEARLVPELQRYNADILQGFTKLYSQGGSILTTRWFDERLTKILSEHYALTQKAFEGSVVDSMPQDASATPAEKKAIAAALAAYFARVAPRRAREINQTTEDDLRASVELATSTQESDKPPLSRIEIGLLAAGIAHRALQSRATSISTTETQLAAESTKATEAEVLLGLTPTVSGGGHRKEQATKQWDSVGDNRVRDAHLEADGQQVLISEPFIVDGESLMFPGDPSLGASAGNIINCRCGVSYNTDDIAEQRMEV